MNRVMKSQSNNSSMNLKPKLMNCSAFNPGNSDNPEEGLNFRVAVCKIGWGAYTYAYTERGAPRWRIEKYRAWFRISCAYFFFVSAEYWSEVTKVGHCLLYRCVRKRDGTQERRVEIELCLLFLFFLSLSSQKPCLSNVARGEPRWIMREPCEIERDGTKRERRKLRNTCWTTCSQKYIITPTIFPSLNYDTWFMDWVLYYSGILIIAINCWEKHVRLWMIERQLYPCILFYTVKII